MNHTMSSLNGAALAEKCHEVSCVINGKNYELKFSPLILAPDKSTELLFLIYFSLFLSSVSIGPTLLPI